MGIFTRAEKGSTSEAAQRAQRAQRVQRVQLAGLNGDCRIKMNSKTAEANLS